eukprot:8212605-Pyramimonas_sp.AAC.1
MDVGPELPRRPAQATKDTKMAQDASKTAQDGPHGAEDCLATAQDASKRAHKGNTRTSNRVRRSPNH